MFQFCKFLNSTHITSELSIMWQCEKPKKKEKWATAEKRKKWNLIVSMSENQNLTQKIVMKTKH